ncbi:MAG: DivIVA domain-containing protein [Ruminococcaceae bacterium]|nr:DivIVA domain-containing protein [Oscillospiraceae bacterium]
MITPQDIREKAFEKAMFGGYDMAGIDEFLEEIANDMTALQKENAILKGKMKVLVEKMDEYRKNEEALNGAVLSAQRLGVMIETEAKQKAAAIIAEAEAEAFEITSAAAEKLAAEEKRLAAAKAASAKFIEGMNAICAKQAAFLKKIGEAEFVKSALASTAKAAPAAPAAPVEMHETVKSIEETVNKVADVPEQTIVPDIAAPQPAFDAAPTRAFGIVSDATVQFSFDSFDDVE